MGTIPIGNKNFEVEEMLIDQQELSFYTENPRVYSVLRENGNDNPSQTEIEELMKATEHVKELRVQIQQNGGLIEPLIVLKKDDENIVLEGNSRLAAYRLLAEKDPITWQKVRCNVLSEEISENEIWILLGIYHLSAKKDWTKFEQAAYVYRQQKALNLPTSTLAKNVGLSEPTVKKYINVYKFMVEDSKDTTQSRWNLYEQYVTNSGIKKYRETNPDMDNVIVSRIKSGEINRAEDIRDKLGKIAKSKSKTASKIMKDIIENGESLDNGYTRFEATGKSGNGYKKIKAFRDLITDDDFILLIKNEATDNTAISFELKKIDKAVAKLMNSLDQKTQQDK